MTTVEANGVTLGVEHFGDAAAPLVLLAGGTTGWAGTWSNVPNGITMKVDWVRFFTGTP